MKPEKRKELLIHEANNPNSKYILVDSNQNLYYFIASVLAMPQGNWEIYKEPKPDIIMFGNDSRYHWSTKWYETLEEANTYKGSNVFAQYKRIICGETGKVKSIELLK